MDGNLVLEVLEEGPHPSANLEDVEMNHHPVCLG